MMKNTEKLNNFYNYIYARKHISCTQSVYSILNYFKKLYYNTPVYDFIEYEEYVPNNLNITPVSNLEGDPIKGKIIANGRISLANQELDIDKNINWRSPLVSKEFLEELHSFEFLHDLAAVNRNQGRAKAIWLIKSWMTEESFVDSTFWSPSILSRRLVNFITYANWLFKECDSHFKKDLMAVILKQSKHLSKTIPWHTQNYDIICAIKGIIYSGLALPQNQSAFLEGLDILKDELEKQILEDSTHMQKNPEMQFQLLKDLVDIRSTMMIANQQVPAIITDSIKTMAESLAFFRHNDGHLAMFNSSFAGEVEKITQLLKICQQNFQTDFLPRAGFRKLLRNDTSIIVDCGEYANTNMFSNSTASALAFELSHNNSRVFISSGNLGDSEHRKSRNFNAIEVDGASSSAVLKCGLTGLTATKVESFKQEEKTLGVGFEGSLLGFAGNKVKHTRRIFLSENGDEVIGEDCITNAKENIQSFFHIHPRYDVKIVDTYNAEILLDGNTIANFKVAGGALRKKQTQICEQNGIIKNKHTLVISSNVNKKETIVRWAISFLD